MKTLYVSDLDGTLLRSNIATSEFTNGVINRLTEQGMIFSYATARSLITAKQVTKGMNASIPLIVYNGAFVIDNATEKIMISNYFDKGIDTVFAELFENEVYPIVYSYIHGIEKFSFIESRCTAEMRAFLDMRKGDIRMNPVKETTSLTQGDCFYITCIDEPEKLMPLYEKFKDMYHCVYQKEIYINAQLLEIMPKAACKSNAVLQLKEYLKCDRIVAFGDGENDIDLFEISDECYAVENAVPELKERATAVIQSNEEDGVAKWLEKHYKQG